MGSICTIFPIFSVNLKLSQTKCELKKSVYSNLAIKVRKNIFLMKICNQDDDHDRTKEIDGLSATQSFNLMDVLIWLGLARATVQELISLDAD